MSLKTDLQEKGISCGMIAKKVINTYTGEPYTRQLVHMVLDGTRNNPEILAEAKRQLKVKGEE